MKKITSLLALFLICFGITASAQTIASIGENITDVASLNTTDYYLLKNVQQKAYLCVKAKTAKTDVLVGTDVAVGGGENYLFQVKIDKNGGYRFVAANGEQIVKLKVQTTAIPTATNGGYGCIFSIEHSTINAAYWTLFDTKSKLYASATNKWLSAVNALDASAEFEIIPVTVVATATVKYKYTLPDQNSKTVTVTQKVGETFNAPGFDYITFTQPEGTVAEGVNEVVVNCTENLPFEKTTDLTQPKWYNVQMHGSRYWKTVATTNADATVTYSIDVVEPAASEDMTVADYKWCFVGDALHGFKIYNEAKGTADALTKTTPASLAPEADAHLWKIETSTDVAGATCFTVDGKNFLNGKANKGDTEQHLYYSNKKGAGSSCKFFSVSADGLKIKAWVDAWTPLANQPGGYAKDVISQVAACATYAEAEAIIKAATKNAVDETEYYQLVNVKNNTALTVVDGNVAQNAIDLSDISSLWKLAKTAEGQYTVQSPNYNQYVNTPGSNALVDAAVSLDIADVDKAEFSIAVGAQFLAQNADGTIGAATSATAEGAHWYLKPVEQIRVHMSPAAGTPAVAEDRWASIYLPFDARCLNGAVKYYGVAATGVDQATLKEMNIVKAGEGAILTANHKQSSFWFKIGTHATLPADATPAEPFTNLLKGTNVAQETAGNGHVYYVLGLNNGEAGLFGSNSTVMKANKAYLEILPEAAPVNGFRFEFGETTGIESVVAPVEEVNAVYYDLSGRRVLNPSNGVYIKNGKKVYVK